MPQLHFSVDAELAEQLAARARAAGKPLSTWLADWVRREVGSGWPEGYLDRVVGCCADAPLVEPDDAPARDVSL